MNNDLRESKQPRLNVDGRYLSIAEFHGLEFPIENFQRTVDEHKPPGLTREFGEVRTSHGLLSDPQRTTYTPTGQTMSPSTRQSAKGIRDANEQDDKVSQAQSDYLSRGL
jgi:hypothetical protein